MCRDGYSKICQLDGCNQTTRCRDSHGYCHDHDDSLEAWYDAMLDDVPSGDVPAVTPYFGKHAAH